MRILCHWLLKIDLLPQNVFLNLRGFGIIMICRCQNAQPYLVIRQTIFNRNGTAFLNWFLRFLYVINVVLWLISTVVFCEIFQNLMLILSCTHGFHEILVAIFRVHFWIDSVLGVLFCCIMRLQNWSKNAYMLLRCTKICSTLRRHQRWIVLGYIFNRGCATSNHWISKRVLVVLGRHHRHILLLYRDWVRIFGRRINSRSQPPIKFGCQNAWGSRSRIETRLIDVGWYWRRWHLNKIHEIFLERI